MLKLKSTVTVLFLSACTGLACGDASAFARRPLPDVPGPVIAPPPSPVVVPAPAPINDVDAGSYEEGLALGRRNGDIIVGRLWDRTIGRAGCSEVDELQNALVKVTRGIKAPPSRGSALVTGFYKGYLGAVRDAVREARSTCSIQGFSDGLFAGNLYGALLCQVSSVSIEVVTALEVESLYDGWSGGSVDVISECRTAADVTLKECATHEGLSEILAFSVEQSCSDRL